MRELSLQKNVLKEKWKKMGVLSMTTIEARNNLTNLKLYLDDIERTTLRVMDLIYQVEEKLCDIELQKQGK